MHRRLQHRNIISLYAAFQEQKFLVLVQVRGACAHACMHGSDGGHLHRFISSNERTDGRRHLGRKGGSSLGAASVYVLSRATSCHVCACPCVMSTVRQRGLWLWTLWGRGGRVQANHRETVSPLLACLLLSLFHARPAQMAHAVTHLMLPPVHQTRQRHAMQFTMRVHCMFAAQEYARRGSSSWPTLAWPSTSRRSAPSRAQVRSGAQEHMRQLSVHMRACVCSAKGHVQALWCMPARGMHAPACPVPVLCS